jgi:hypothetical protein
MCRGMGASDHARCPLELKYHEKTMVEPARMSSTQPANGAILNARTVQPHFFTMKTLAIYSSCSVRWLRDRLVDRVHPLPHYRVEGKILVKKEDFDAWMVEFRIDRATDELGDIVADVLANMNL